MDENIAKLVAVLILLLVALTQYAISWLTARSAVTKAKGEQAAREAVITLQATKEKQELERKQEQERIASAEAFRSAFAEIKHDFDEERRKNERSERRINELVGLHSEDAGKISILEGNLATLQREAQTTAATVKRLEETLITRTSERDEALAKVIKLNGEVELRDKQIAQLKTSLDEMKAAQEAMQKQIQTLQEAQKKNTDKLDPATVPATDPALGQQPQAPLTDSDEGAPLDASTITVDTNEKDKENKSNV